MSDLHVFDLALGQLDCTWLPRSRWYPFAGRQSLQIETGGEQDAQDSESRYPLPW